ncbi:hypothetical protein FO519_008285, partial [Halicephalobus sp. NKZ332]
DDVLAALKTFEGMEIKGKLLKTKRVAEEPLSRQRMQARSPQPIRTAKEIATPLAHLSYDEQLKQKQEASFKIALNIKKQAIQAGIQSAKSWRIENLLKPIVASPVMEKYRNKTELTVGYDEKGEICIGFVGTKLQEKRLITVPIYDCSHIRQNTLNVSRAFEEFVKQSELLPFNEFERQGCWKTILIRDFLADCMVVVTIFPLSDEAAYPKVKEQLTELFMGPNQTEKQFRVTSLYLAIQANSSDEPKLEKIGGAPYVYENLFNLRFRISPNTFFQTNTIAAEVLYTVIGDALGLPAPQKKIRLPAIATEENWNKGGLMSLVPNEPEGGESEPESKKKKPNTEGSAETEGPNRIMLLDICCGAGTIGLSLGQRMAEAKKEGQFDGIYGVVGVEIVKEAIADAELTIKDNWLDASYFRYVAGSAEAIFPSLNFYAPSCFKGNTNEAELKAGEIVGVLDPPRAGIPGKCILGCRKLAEMKRLVYVSCDPNGALKNIIDLCRPQSRKYEGTPFTITSIQPVDMFPMTSHFEWVIQLDR